MTALSSSPSRRSLLAGSAATGAATFLAMHLVSARDASATDKSNQGRAPTVGTEADAVRPFRVNVPDEDLANLRRRLSATRLPAKELVEDRSQGVQLATLRALARYWSTEYDWSKCEARLNALPQFMTKIDGVDIHFIHVQSRHENALPLIMTHGWPGSVIELLDTVGPLTDPTKYGGNPDDAFHLVLPSLPGYGFSAEPTELGWDSARIARAWAKLMERLGYTRYVAQGGDVGAAVTDSMGRQAPKGLLGIHVNLLAGSRALPTSCQPDPRRNARRRRRQRRSGRAASATSWSSRPGLRRSVTRCWTRLSGSRLGCSTMIPTVTTKFPKRSWRLGLSATLPGKTSSTTLRSTG